MEKHTEEAQEDFEKTDSCLFNVMQYVRFLLSASATSPSSSLWKIEKRREERWKEATFNSYCRRMEYFIHYSLILISIFGKRLKDFQKVFIRFPKKHKERKANRRKLGKYGL